MVCVWYVVCGVVCGVCVWCGVCGMLWCGVVCVWYVVWYVICGVCVWYAVVWCGVVCGMWCGMWCVWYAVVWCGVVCVVCGVVWYVCVCVCTHVRYVCASILLFMMFSYLIRCGITRLGTLSGQSRGTQTQYRTLPSITRANC